MNIENHRCRKFKIKRIVSKSEIHDPFYSDSNMRYLEKILSEIDAGTAVLVEHDLIEIEED